MRVIFAGTPEFAVPALAALIEADVEIVAVYSQPDRPAGRGKKLTASPVKQLALENDLRVEQPIRFDSDAIDVWCDIDADLAVVAAYGLLLPEAVLESPRLGCINIHASLLPRWRGAAPINRAIEAGDTETGITLMQMDKGLDTGAMLATAPVAIEHDTNAATLHDQLSILGGDLLIKQLPAIASGNVDPVAQNDSDATYARKLSKAESPVDWSLSAAVIARRIRAFVPWPVATADYDGTTLKLWDAHHDDTAVDQPFGSVIRADKKGVVIATGSGSVVITRLQRPGAKPVAAADFLNGFPLTPGNTLGDDST